MISGIKQKLRICRAVAAVTYKEWSAYRTHSLVSVFVGPVYFIVQYFIWTAVYGERAVLGGMDLSGTIRYFGVIALIGYITMDFADWNLQMLVGTGKFLTFALRPMHHRFYALSQKIGHRTLGFFLEFLPCFFIFEFLFRVDMVPPRIGWTVLSVVFAFLMNFYVNYCLGMTAFFFVRADGIRQVYQLAGSVLSGAMIPLSFFPEPLYRIMMFLPFQYTGYIPAMVWTGSESIGAAGLNIPQAVMCQAAAVLLAALLSEIIYRISIKRFTAVGA